MKRASPAVVPPEYPAFCRRSSRATIASSRNGAFFMSRALPPLAASQGSMRTDLMFGRAGTRSPLTVVSTCQLWSQLRVKVDSVAGSVVPATDCMRAPNVQAPWVAGDGGGVPVLRQGPQVVRRQSSTTETSVTNSSFSGTTVQADWIGSPLTSRLVRTAACWAGVPSSVRETEAKAIRDPPRTITSRARTILGLICERRRLIASSLGTARPRDGDYVPLQRR